MDHGYANGTCYTHTPTYSVSTQVVENIKYILGDLIRQRLARGNTQSGENRNCKDQ